MKRLKVFFGFIVATFGMMTFTMTLRGWYLRFLKFFGNIGLKIAPSIYTVMDKQNAEYTSGHRIKESYMDKARLNERLRNIEKTQWKKEDIVEEFQNELSRCQVPHTALEKIFDNADKNLEVAVQYSGGCDSTLVAMLAAQYFKRVHMVNFTHRFIGQPEKSKLNAQKIINIFSPEKILYVNQSSTDLLKKLLFKDYFQDMKKYKTFIVGIGCLACKLSFDICMIKYALENNVKVVLDGADLSVKTQLSQGDKRILDKRGEFFSSYGIQFMHPAVYFTNNAFELLNLGFKLDSKTIMYAEQPECIGNQFLNEVYDRFYYLPKYGVEQHSKEGYNWLLDKLNMCKSYIETDR